MTTRVITRLPAHVKSLTTFASTLHFLPDISKAIKSQNFILVAYSYKIYETRSPKARLIWGWSGGAMVLGKLPVPGRPTIWITVGQGPTALVVGADGCCLDVFTLIYPFLFSV